MKSREPKEKQKHRGKLNDHIPSSERGATGGSEWRVAGTVKDGWRTGVTWDGTETRGEERVEGRWDEEPGSSFPNTYEQSQFSENSKPPKTNDMVLPGQGCQAKLMTSYSLDKDVMIWLGIFSFRKIHTLTVVSSLCSVAVE
jgi:hypothetical protein